MSSTAKGRVRILRAVMVAGMAVWAAGAMAVPLDAAPAPPQPVSAPVVDARYQEALAQAEQEQTPEQVQREADWAARYQEARQQLSARHPEVAVRLLKAVADEMWAHAQQGVDGKELYFCWRGDDEELARILMPALLDKSQRFVVMGSQICDAMYWQAYALVELHRKAEAQALLERLLALAPTRAQVKLELGQLLASSGQPQRGLALFTEAEENARFEPEMEQARWRAQAQRGQGYALVELKRWDEAESAYARSLTLAPESQLARQEIGYIRQQRRAAEAAAAASSAGQ